eukprot:6186354-Pleurochrysis_carterae.AAC.3
MRVGIDAGFEAMAGPGRMAVRSTQSTGLLERARSRRIASSMGKHTCRNTSTNAASVRSTTDARRLNHYL